MSSPRARSCTAACSYRRTKREEQTARLLSPCAGPCDVFVQKGRICFRLAHGAGAYFLSCSTAAPPSSSRVECRSALFARKRRLCSGRQGSAWLGARRTSAPAYTRAAFMTYWQHPEGEGYVQARGRVHARLGPHTHTTWPGASTSELVHVVVVLAGRYWPCCAGTGDIDQGFNVECPSPGAQHWLRPAAISVRRVRLPALPAPHRL